MRLVSSIQITERHNGTFVNKRKEKRIEQNTKCIPRRPKHPACSRHFTVQRSPKGNHSSTQKQVSAGHYIPPKKGTRLETTSPARVHTSPLIILSRNLNGIGTRGISSRLVLVLLLVLLDLLSLARALVVQLLVLGLDLGFAVFGVGATAAGTGLYISVCSWS